MSKKLGGWIGKLLVFLCCLLLMPTATYAEYSSSNNYRIDESTIGSGNLNQSSSNNYTGIDTTGDLSVGNSTGNNYQIETGSQTPHDPTLAVTIDNEAANFDDLFSPTSTSTATASFSVLNYTSWGYVAQIIGDPPTYDGHTIHAMDTTDQSQNGVEQFGMNLVANTQPKTFGTNLDNGQFGFGEVANGYNTPNSYRYVEGETIAMAPKSSGVTKYTISYIVNVTGITPAGQYTGGQTIIVTGTY